MEYDQVGDTVKPRRKYLDIIREHRLGIHFHVLESYKNCYPDSNEGYEVQRVGRCFALCQCSFDGGWDCIGNLHKKISVRNSAVKKCIGSVQIAKPSSYGSKLLV